VTARAWAAGLALGGVAAVAGGNAAWAIHTSADVPLAIAPEDVQRYRDAGEEVIVIDLRPAASFAKGHLPHARSMPIAEVKRREPEVPRSGRVVLYAATPEEAAAAYQYLRDTGHRNVMVLAGGLPGWVRLGYPMETAP
jgi:rhodanese-related sulfurtransferase